MWTNLDRINQAAKERLGYPRQKHVANTGSYVSGFNGQKYPRLQIRTIGQLLDGVMVERPSGNVAADETFKKAPKVSARIQEQPKLGL